MEVAGVQKTPRQDFIVDSRRVIIHKTASWKKCFKYHGKCAGEREFVLSSTQCRSQNPLPVASWSSCLRFYALSYRLLYLHNVCTEIVEYR